jgi:hypothetical protein
MRNTRREGVGAARQGFGERFHWGGSTDAQRLIGVNLMVARRGRVAETGVPRERLGRRTRACRCAISHQVLAILTWP